MLVALGTSQTAIAQQGWSPQPFTPNPQTRPLNDARAVPANTLRGDSTPADQSPVVLRWRSQSKTQTVDKLPASAAFAESRTASSPVPQAARPEVVASLQPSFAKPFASSPSAVKPAADWSARNSDPNSPVVRSVLEPEPFQHQWSDRSSQLNTVTYAQFDTPPASNPSGEFPKDLFESNLLPPQEPTTEAVPPSPKSNSMRSLIEPKSEELPANPFPPSSNKVDPDRILLEDSVPPSMGLSPSDLELPPPNFNRSNDRDSGSSVPPKPKSAKRVDLNCDQVRDRVMSANIGTIELDVAPNFGVGPKDKQSPDEKRAAFAQSAPSRTWYSQSGQNLADGRLVDFAHDTIVVETSNGSRRQIPMRDLSEPDATYVYEAWGLPVTCSLGEQRLAARVNEPTTVAWKASGLCHKPLYFEEIQLERSGHEYGPIAQPAISTIHFFKNIAVLPYKMGIHPMTECQYALGHYRPGNCAPWSIEPIPLSLRGAAAQAKVITGAALILP